MSQGYYTETTSFSVQPPAYFVQPPTAVVYQTVGNCPSCHAGNLQSEMSCLGIFCCVIFFPIGIICLLLMQDQRCPNCGYST